MEITSNFIIQAWKRAGGKCECKSVTHGHEERCNKRLIFDYLGHRGYSGAWNAHIDNSIDGDVFERIRIFCSSCNTLNGTVHKH